MTYKNLLKELKKKAKDKKRSTSSVEYLFKEIAENLNINLYLDYDLDASDEFIQKATSIINEYIENNTAPQYLLGYSYFYGRKFIVNSDVLIPRCETEELCAYVLNAYDEVFRGKCVRVVDVGSGSGAIAVTLALEEAKMEVSATDISIDALKVARVNAENLGANLTIYEGDMLKPLIERALKFDILVSNPPYICDSEYVEDVVIDNEPHVALFGGSDGMKFYDIILKDAKKVLNTPAIIAFEHGFNKRSEMASLIKKYLGDVDFETIKDLQGKDRITIIKLV